MADQLLSDADIFGAAPASPPTADGLLSDADVFGPSPEEGPGFWSNVGQNALEIGKGVPSGAGQMVGTTLKGAAGLLNAPPQPETDALIPNPMDLAWRAGRRLAESVTGKTEPVPTQETALYRAGDAVAKAAQGVLPAEPGYEESPGRLVGEGLGSLAVGAAASMLPGGQVLGPAAFAMAGSGEAIDNAIKAGATEEQIIQAAKLGLIPGMTDSLPVETLLGRIPIPGAKAIQVPAGMLGSAIRGIGRIGWQAFIEGAQEGGQQFLQNLISREVHSPDQSLSDEVLPNAAVGGGVGAIAETGRLALQNFAGRRGRPPGGEEDARVSGQPAPPSVDPFEQAAETVQPLASGRPTEDLIAEEVARRQAPLDLTDVAEDAPLDLTEIVTDAAPADSRRMLSSGVPVEQVDAFLAGSGIPNAGARVSVYRPGRGAITATVEDGFLGDMQVPDSHGVVLRMDDGRSISVTLGELQSNGIGIAPLRVLGGPAGQPAGKLPPPRRSGATMTHGDGFTMQGEDASQRALPSPRMLTPEGYIPGGGFIAREPSARPPRTVKNSRGAPFRYERPAGTEAPVAPAVSPPPQERVAQEPPVAGIAPAQPAAPQIGPAVAPPSPAVAPDITPVAMPTAPRERIRKPVGIAEAIARDGGITDPGGELRAMNMDRWDRGRVGMPRLVVAEDRQQRDMMGGIGRASTRSPDYRLTWAIERGYLPPDATLSDLFEAIAENRPTMEAQVVAAERSLETEAERQQRAALNALAAEAAARGGGMTDDDMAQALALMADGYTAEEAVIEVMERGSVAWSDAASRPAEEQDDGQDTDIPFPDDVAAAAPAGEGDSPARGDAGQPDAGAAEGRPAPRRESGVDQRPADAVPPDDLIDTLDGPRQQAVIPGAERISDKQAAERRMQGRKRTSAQQKGLEGLGIFDPEARPDAQPDLLSQPTAPKRSRHQNVNEPIPGVGDFYGEAGDLVSEFGDKATKARDAAAHEAARQFVLSRNDGWEHLVMLDVAANDLLSVGTIRNKSTVTFTDAVNDAVENPQRRIVGHHNHPSSRALSKGDVSILANPGLRVVVAHGKNGRVSAARLTPSAVAHLGTMGIAEGRSRIHAIASRTDEAARRVIQDAISRNEVTVEDANMLHHDIVNRALAKIGLIQYYTSYPVSEQAAFEQALAKATDAARAAGGKDANFVPHDRHTVAIRAEGDMGIVLAGDGVAAGGRSGGRAGETRSEGGPGAVRNGDFESRLRRTKFTAETAAQAPDGSRYRIKREGDGYIAMRMPQKRGDPPRYYRPDDGRVWSEDQAIARVVAEVEQAGPGQKPGPSDSGERFQIARSVTQSPEFKRWFGDSKVVDANGEPLVVYHGTNADIEAFDAAKGASTTGARSSRMGFFFAGDPAVASGYVQYHDPYNEIPIIRFINRITRGGYARLNEAVQRPFGSTAILADGNVMPTYLSMQNPLEIDLRGGNYDDTPFSDIIRAAKEDDRDGVIIRNTFDPGFARDDSDHVQTDIFIAFRPEQIKSATGNRGTFDPNDPRIRYDISARAPDAETVDAEGETGLRARIEFSAAGDARREAAYRVLREVLDSMGLRDVRLRVPDRIVAVDGRQQIVAQVGGRYLDRLIDVALAPERDYRQTLGHEAIHALREMGLILPHEWATLARTVTMDEARMADVRARYARQGLPQDALIEEAVADLFGEWMVGRAQAHGRMRAAFDRMLDFLRRLGNALIGRGFRSADSVFRSIERGDMGARPRNANRTEEKFQIAGVPPRTETERQAKRATEGVARRTLDMIRRTARWAASPLGTLPEQRTYMIARYRAMGEIARVEEIAKHLNKAFSGASRADQDAVYTYLTTKDASADAIADAAVRAAAVQAKKLVDDVGRALVKRGLLPRDVYEQNKGSYLPRVYLRHLLGGDIRLAGGSKASDLGYLKKRKDIPEDVRAVILGEITDPGYLTAKAYGQPMRDMAILDLLQEVAGTREWVFPESLVEWDGRKVSAFWLKEEAERIKAQIPYMRDATWADAARALVARMDGLADPAIEASGKAPADYERVPTSRRYGALAGMLVRKEIHSDLIGTVRMLQGEESLPERVLGEGGIAAKVTQWWKLSKVALNPPTQARNFVSNAVLLHLSGVPLYRVPQRMVQAAQEIRRNGKHYQVAKRFGVTGSTFAHSELRQIQTDFLRAQAMNGHPWAKLKAMGGAVAKFAGDTYQLSEVLFKTARIIDGMEREGKSAEDAALDAHRSLFDYSLVSPGVRYLRNAPIGMPFITFYAKALPFMVETVVKRPLRLLPYVALPYIWSAWLQDLYDVDDDDLEALKMALPEWLRQRGHVYLLPFKDEEGRWQATNIGYFFPWSMFQEAGNEIADGEFGNLLSTTGLLGGPLPDIIAAIKTNVDPFTQKQIVDERESPARQIAAMLSYAWRLGAPTWVTDIGFAGHLYRTLTNAVDPKTGEPTLDGFQSIARITGLNVYPIQPRKTRAANIRWMEYEIEQVERRMKELLKDRNLTPEDRRGVRKEFVDLLRKRQDALREYVQASRIHPNLE